MSETAAALAPTAAPVERSRRALARTPRWGRPEIATWVVDLARRLDSQYRIPVVGWRFGLDGVLGLVPVVGDLLTAAYGAAIVFEAVRLRAPRTLVARMVGNLAFDALIGSVPVVGDAADFLYKPNERNLRLLERDLARRPGPRTAKQRGEST